MSTLTTTRPEPAPRVSRPWALLCAAGRGITADLATENGWMWAYGLGYPYVGPTAPPWRITSGDRR